MKGYIDIFKSVCVYTSISKRIWNFCCVNFKIIWALLLLYLHSGPYCNQILFFLNIFSLFATAATNFVFKRINEECIFQRHK